MSGLSDAVKVASNKTAKGKLAKRTVPRSTSNSVAIDVLSLKITLRGIKPPIWRRILVQGGMTLSELHYAIQAALGWTDSHLHAFEIGGEQYGDPRIMDDVADENRLTLNSIMKSGITRFEYTYDFGDSWEHLITIEKTQPAIDGKLYPACIAGARSCPPEDCGGIWGYRHLLEVLADSAHPEYDEQTEWIGEDFDPEKFVLETANTMVSACLNEK